MRDQDCQAGNIALRGKAVVECSRQAPEDIFLVDLCALLQFPFDFFHIFNHPNFLDPGLNLEDPTNFGVITTQITPNPEGFPLAQTFYRPRAIQIGARIQF